MGSKLGRRLDQSFSRLWSELIHSRRLRWVYSPRIIYRCDLRGDGRGILPLETYLVGMFGLVLLVSDHYSQSKRTTKSQRQYSTPAYPSLSDARLYSYCPHATRSYRTYNGAWSELVHLSLGTTKLNQRYYGHRLRIHNFFPNPPTPHLDCPHPHPSCLSWGVRAHHTPVYHLLYNPLILFKCLKRFAYLHLSAESTRSEYMKTERGRFPVEYCAAGARPWNQSLSIMPNCF